ncbi:putative pectinesterase 63 [Ricinus communis]|jgi:pectinesterase|uniref:Pectinesterase n=1 Tax=Ricinus communis TaxID=3988 RepID=B9SW55_RICCO|nr:putative pectinesterase 63 [Ricinus communis]EEF32171.1 Pectinesterase U1 precursor, putative [Ricinus communis]|eukprot:XP_002530224.1 putative pectinesterase 63 [Ricinus communis]
MVRGMTSLDAIKCAIILVLAVLISTATSDDTEQIPESQSALNSWFEANVKPYASRKGTLNPALEAAEANPKTIKVRTDGSGDFKTVTDALKSIPVKNTQRVIVDIGPGVYTEKITVDIQKPFVTLYGSPNAMPTLAFGGTAKEYGTDDSATLIVMSDYFVAANIIIKNTAPRPNGKPQGQAVALRLWGSKAAIYNCRILGFQDTLCDDHGMHFFKDCYIEGTIDFIFGLGKSIYLNSIIHVVDDKLLTVITAQAGSDPKEDTGFVFVHCSITGDGTGAFLGRAWMPMPRVVFAYTRMGKVIHPGGWFNNFHPERERTVSFAEYKSTGPGYKPNERVKYSKQLTDTEAKKYISLGYIEGSTWLLPPPKL